MKFLLIIIITAVAAPSWAQNLPSLLTGRNINSTYSITAYDEAAQEWGIAVATDNIYVGNSTIYIRPGRGAFSVIAETEPKYAEEGFSKLERGQSIVEAIEEVRSTDEHSHYRQVAGIDAEGNTYAFTGESLNYWKGHSSSLAGDHFVVMGNQLSSQALGAMSGAFESSEGTLAQRLLTSLQAGRDAGGQISGKQSAAVVVKGLTNEWYNQIDLRVDHSRQPIEDLQVLMDYHYGRIELNRSLYAIRSGNVSLGRTRLLRAEEMLKGWTGIYSRIAQAHITLGDEEDAVRWISRGLQENPQWSVNLPAFYVLRNHPKMEGLIDPSTFSMTDWEHALGMYSNLGREAELIGLADELLEKQLESTYLHYLLGRAYHFEKDLAKAREHLLRALQLDGNNVEAKQLLNRVQGSEGSQRD
ncbi:MAG: DUF1028 domain-containing protein [Bacteroidota bacterium]